MALILQQLIYQNDCPDIVPHLNSRALKIAHDNSLVP